MTLDTFQLGEPVEHRGIVVTPLFPRRDPVAAYITLDEALPRGLRITETSDSGSVPELFVENPTDSARAALRRRGARRREAEPDPQRQRPRRRGREAADPRLVRRAGTLEPAERRIRLREAHLALPPPAPQGRDARRAAARARARPGRRLGRGARQADADGRPLPRPPRTATRSRRMRPGSRRSSRRSRSRPASAAPCSESATTSASTPSRDPTPSRSSGRSSAPATCSTRSSGSTAARRPSSGSPRSWTPSAEAHDARPVGRARRGPAAPRRGVVGSGLELDGETIQLSAFTSDDGGARAFGRIARPSARR